jgi:hypothetical protein
MNNAAAFVLGLLIGWLVEWAVDWILTNIPNTQVEIIGGPACTRYEYGGSYLWWQIKLPNGLIGWSAEASAFGKFYFMEPAP